MIRRFLDLTIPGRPAAKGRPRFAKSGHVYTPERTRNAEANMQGEMRQVCTEPFSGPLELSLLFCFKRPSSWPKALRDRVDDGYEPVYQGKPDLDNLVKLVKDAANGILWLDDAQVVKLEARKRYADRSETIINVMSISEDLPLVEWKGSQSHSSKLRGPRGGKK